MTRALIALCILAVLPILQGCRIGTAVFEGGEVISGSGDRDCREGRTCEFTVSDTNFSETFTAQARVGYEFVRWRAGDNHLCANSTNPVCTVSNVGTEGNATIESIVASEEMFYVVPEFRCVISSCPTVLLDSVLLDLVEASELVDNYVAATGGYPPTNYSFGINTSNRPQNPLILRIDVQSRLYPDSIVYISAEVYTSLWDGTASPNPASIAYFSLSGSLDADTTMSWQCIPGNGQHPNPGVPNAYLPIECRW